MNNYQKLASLATYVSTITHYPGSGCTKKEVNPTLWDRLGVEGVGTYSSAPYNISHESVIYKYPDESTSYIDLQGTTSNTSCEEHGCLEHVLSFK